MNGIIPTDRNHPDRVVTRGHIVHIPDTRLKKRRSREDCDRCSLNGDAEGCLRAKCRNNIYKALP